MSGFFFNDYPYTDFHELNLTWLIKKMIELNETVKNFVSLNAIKYADPIQWNIASQYEKNTVVVDPQTGTAYLSVAPVPSGVAISNPDYWTVIFDLDIAQANNNITLRDDGNNVLSTFTSDAGDWLLWNGTLYIVTQAIGLSQAYVPGYNIDRYTVELFVKDYFNVLSTIIGDLNDLNTTDKDSIVDAINEVLQTITDRSIYAYPEDFGAVGDGVTDDSTAFQNAVNSGKIVYLRNSYAIDSITISSPTKIIGADESMIYPNTVSGTILFKNVFTATANLTLDNLHFEGQGRYPTTPATRYSLINVSSCDYLHIKNCSIKNIGHNYVSVTEPMNDYIPLWIKAVDVLDVTIEDCQFIEGGSDELMVITPWTLTSPSKPSITLKNNTFIDCEHGASMNLIAYDVNISHNTFNNFVYPGSIFNLTGENVNCDHNTFNACDVGSVFDALEACWFHAENFNVLDNIFTGTCDIFAEFVGERGQICGNSIEANTLIFNELTVFSTTNMPAMLRNTRVREHGSLIIKDNKCKISGGTAPVIRFFAVQANATSDIPFTDYKGQDLVVISGNNFDFVNFFTSSNKFFITGTGASSSVVIEDNVISNPNVDGLSGSAKWLYNIDNRYVDRVMKNITFKSNVIMDINAVFTNGIRLCEVADATNPIQLLSDIANIAYGSSILTGTTAYVTLKQL